MSQELATTVIDEQPQKGKVNLMGGFLRLVLARFLKKLVRNGSERRRLSNGFTKRVNAILTQ